jgi:hypothetical protein
MPRVFEEIRVNGVNKRYEVDTAYTEASSGYKFMRKSPSNDIGVRIIDLLMARLYLKFCHCVNLKVFF